MMLSTIDIGAASITSTPSPAVSNKPLEIKITGQDLGSTVYCYTWCASVNGQEKSPFQWNDVNTAKFQMTGSNGNYTFAISDLKSFYGLTDNELAGLTKLGFIAKNSNGGQTDDLFVEVVQGRKDAYSGGEGTASNPFILKKSADLQTLATTPSDWTSENYFRMDADLDGTVLTSGIGSVSTPFAATFDGNGHTINNLLLSGSGVGSATGLFACVNGATIRNLGVTGAYVKGSTYTGILVGLLRGGTIERCFTMGAVVGNSICVGGLVGENEAGGILNCYSGATVSNASDYATGGLVGKNRGSISNTYAAGAVEGFDYVGGLVGANYSTISNSVALNGEITGYNDYVARFGGNNNSRNMSTGNYTWEHTTAIHGQWASHGDHAAPRTADLLRDEMQFRALTGWDFNNVWEWRNEAGKGYPALRGISNQLSPMHDRFYSISSVQDMAADTEYIYVGPNPTHGELQINASAGIDSYALYSINGQLVMGEKRFGDTHVIIDLSGMDNGLYILRTVTATGNEKINKIIKR